MPPLASSLTARLPVIDAIARVSRLALIAVPHLAALALMAWSEEGPLRMAAFLLTWGILNFFWLTLLRRPALSAVLSLLIVVVLILISRFKFNILGMTASFIDVMIIDSDTFTFLWMVFPQVRTAALAGLVLGVLAAVLIWRLDPFRVRRRTALTGLAACAGGLSALAFAVPLPLGETFGDVNYVSAFARSGVGDIAEYVTRGYYESDPTADGALASGAADACEPAGKRPHILLIHDEGSFDLRDVNGIKLPDGYGAHFLSFDGKERRFLVEGAGGPSWYTEYNVIAGLSTRSFGRFQFFVTRVAAGRVIRGLPRALERCGYRTFTVYPAYGGFLGAKSFFTGAGIEHFADGRDLGAAVFERDSFYLGAASRRIAEERGKGPLFLYVYTAANHFPWTHPLWPETTPGWRNPGNTPPEVDEYLRRQSVSAREYQEFLVGLKREFPDDAFLIVRYGDHQPDFGKLIADRSIDIEELKRRLMAYDPRYLTTYYAIDAINFQPVNLSSAADLLDAPYLPLVVQEAAGLPLDASFAEQKRIFERCKPLFYGCNNGAEARRFNRLLINAGLIRGL